MSRGLQPPVAEPLSELRALRKRQGWSQQELADRAGIGVRTVRALESGTVSRPQRASIQRLADALRLSNADRCALESSWTAAQRVRSFDSQVADGHDIESVLRDHRWVESSHRALSMQLEVVVGGDGRQMFHTERRVALVTDSGACYRWTLYGNAPDIDVNRIRVAESIGAELSERLIFPGGEPGDDLVAFRWQLDSGIEAGQEYIHSCTLDFRDAITSPSAPVDTRWLIGLRRTTPLLVMVLRFDDNPPGHVYEHSGPDRHNLDVVREVHPQTPGVYTLVYRYPDSGLHGFDWSPG